MSQELKNKIDKGESGDDLLKGQGGISGQGGSQSDMGGMTPPDMGGSQGGMQGGMGGQSGSTDMTPPDGFGGGQGGMTPPDGFGGGQGGMSDMTPPDGMNGDQGGMIMPDDNQSDDSSQKGKGGFSEELGGMAGALMSSGDCKLTINGGTLKVDAYGDGLDSNGDIEINGGTTLVNGPQMNGNAALDYGEQGTAKVNGGVVLMVGSSGMAEDFSGGSQPFNLSSASGSSGQVVRIQDASGKVIAELTATKAFQVVYSSAPSYTTSSTYNIVIGGQTSTSFTPSTTASQVSKMGGGMGRMQGGSQDSSGQQDNMGGGRR